MEYNYHFSRRNKIIQFSQFGLSISKNTHHKLFVKFKRALRAYVFDLKNERREESYIGQSDFKVFFCLKKSENLFTLNLESVEHFPPNSCVGYGEIAQ